MTDITELAQSLKAAADREMICRDGAETSEIWERTVTPENILALVEALEKAQRANGYLREQSAEWERKAISNFEDCAEMSARVEELESQRKLAFTASSRWADKFREAEKRIAELEFRSVTVKLPPKIERNDADGWFMYNCGRVGGGAAEWYNKALDDVGAELTAAGIKVEAE
ncbi:hypothetical protein NGH11_15010 [Klebsiella pneumoniae]|uniref:hypothetical protein n=1 Tax=Klebsiella pneumoniae TaxID=573 RepID=UPI000583CF68|nr:hypothetical protein [Klebsiella pneumoniae]KHF50798.1 hypothetical protein LT24_05292 [Klebsiella pneumoniae]MCO0834599.1 hypothetical protein [Klebsiella pneumoniae]MCO0850254.1 hypothetical protein [Klebsiella pneumoniae]MCO0870811.1 hypothetical protein [Klebsiella pneumoniae]MCO0875540.1 hypothetical protein [Klebsiella pneumoniae]